MKYVVYKFSDDSVEVFVLINEHAPYDQMVVEYEDSGLPFELTNYGHNYVVCETIEEANTIKTKAAKCRKRIKRERDKFNTLFGSDHTENCGQP